MVVIDTLRLRLADQTIYPFDSYYARKDMLDSKQLRSYQYISEQISKGNKIDIEGNISYLFAFLFETTRELLDSKDYEIALKKISQLQDLYGDSHRSLNQYCTQSTVDILLCAGNHKESMKILEKIVAGKDKAAGAANMLINLKHKFGGQISAEELLSTAGKLSWFGKENIDGILNIMSILLNEANQREPLNIIEEIFTDEKKTPTKKGEWPLFVGNPYGFDLGEHLVPPEYKEGYISFYKNEKFVHFVEELSRISENMLRESKGLPKINEGWLNETKLYYAVQEAFSQYNVIHQYRCIWLGLQSLDIFIEGLNIGIEYQGAQHLRPVDFFGGEEAFRKTQKRDKKKKKLCDENGVKLIYVYEGYELDDVLEEINSFISESGIILKPKVATPSLSVSEAETSSVDLNALFSSALANENPDEKRFLDSLFVKLKQNNFNPSLLTWDRLADKTLNILYNDCQIGRIKLIARKTRMQVLTDNGVAWNENRPLDEYIKDQDKWIEYIKTSPLEIFGGAC